MSIYDIHVEETVLDRFMCRAQHLSVAIIRLVFFTHVSRPGCMFRFAVAFHSAGFVLDVSAAHNMDDPDRDAWESACDEAEELSLLSIPDYLSPQLESMTTLSSFLEADYTMASMAAEDAPVSRAASSTQWPNAPNMAHAPALPENVAPRGGQLVSSIPIVLAGGESQQQQPSEVGSIDGTF